MPSTNIQLETALKDDPHVSPTAKAMLNLPETPEFQLVPAPNGYVQFSSKLLEEKPSRTWP